VDPHKTSVAIDGSVASADPAWVAVSHGRGSWPDAPDLEALVREATGRRSPGSGPRPRWSRWRVRWYLRYGLEGCKFGGGVRNWAFWCW